MKDKLPSHLGGHNNVSHLDLGALSFLKSKFNINSLLDIGCGLGKMELLCSKIGIEYCGIDGDFTLSHAGSVLIHDYTKGYSPLNRHFDLGWSTEFVEHVYPEFIPNYMKDFALCDKVMLTFAPKGKKGHHHVNCQNEGYWVDIFQKHGFDFLIDVTEEIRLHSSMKREFVRENGLFFKKH